MTRPTPTRSGFACKYAGLEVLTGLRELQSNVAIRSIVFETYPPETNEALM